MENGGELERDTYDPFGTLEKQKSQNDDNKLFTGKERDFETGLDYFGARYYDPFIGRWISRDPLTGKLSKPISLNRYQYVFNNPMTFIDPDGMKPDIAQRILVKTITKKSAEDTIIEGVIRTLSQIESVMNIPQDERMPPDLKAKMGSEFYNKVSSKIFWHQILEGQKVEGVFGTLTPNPKSKVLSTAKLKDLYSFKDARNKSRAGGDKVFEKIIGKMEMVGGKQVYTPGTVIKKESEYKKAIEARDASRAIQDKILNKAIKDRGGDPDKK